MDRNWCGCGIANWAKAIAWILAIAYASVALYFAVRLGSGIGMVPWGLVDRGVLMTPDAAYTLSVEAHNLTIVSSTVMALGILSFVVSLLLLKGIYDTSLKLINTWIVAASICLTFWIAMSICWSLFTFRDLRTIILMGATGPILMLVLQGFCLWMVCSYRRIIRAGETLGVQYYPTDE